MKTVDSTLFGLFIEKKCIHSGTLVEMMNLSQETIEKMKPYETCNVSFINVSLENDQVVRKQGRKVVTYTKLPKKNGFEERIYID